MSFSPVNESRIRQLTEARTSRDKARAKTTAELERRAKDEEQRTTISPRDLERQAQAKANWDYWCAVYDQQQERERQQKIAKANPTLIKLKTEYLADKATPSRRVQLVREFVELYRQAYRKAVPVEVLAKEWEQERRQATLQKIYGAASGAGTSEAK